MGDELSASGTGRRRRVVTVNQIVGFNMKWFRQAAGLTQEELGRRLGGWSKGVVSAAERSWVGERVRQFDLDEVAAIAKATGVPVAALLLPPPDTSVEYTFITGGGEIDQAELLSLVMTDFRGDSPAMSAFRDRLAALGAAGYYLDAQQAQVELAGLKVAAAHAAADATRAEAAVIEASARAGELDRKAQERYRWAMGSLVQQREELERRVNDLRDFEREYRNRLLAYFEGQIRDLHAGAADQAAFPPVGEPPQRPPRTMPAGEEADGG